MGGGRTAAPAFRRQGGRLTLASALLLLTCLLWVLAAILDVVGPLGPVMPGYLAWAAMLLDLPGVVLLASVYFGHAREAAGRSRLLRHGAAWLLVLWAVLSAYWRFVLPSVAQSNLQDLAEGFLGVYPQGLALARASPATIEEMFGLWLAAACVFVLAHALIALDYRRAEEADWVRGLPVYAWLLGALVSLAGSAAIVVGIWPTLWGGVLGDAFTTGAILKLLVAPNLLLSGYAASLRLGHAVSRMERAVPAE